VLLQGLSAGKKKKEKSETEKPTDEDKDFISLCLREHLKKPKGTSMRDLLFKVSSWHTKKLISEIFTKFYADVGPSISRIRWSRRTLDSCLDNGRQE
jgi:hypothetical protein